MDSHGAHCLPVVWIFIYNSALTEITVRTMFVMLTVNREIDVCKSLMYKTWWRDWHNTYMIRANKRKLCIHIKNLYIEIKTSFNETLILTIQQWSYELQNSKRIY